MTDKTPIAAMARMAGQMTAAAAAGQAVGLNVLLAEMQALAGVMPGVMTRRTPPMAPRMRPRNAASRRKPKRISTTCRSEGRPWLWTSPPPLRLMAAGGAGHE